MHRELHALKGAMLGHHTVDEQPARPDSEGKSLHQEAMKFRAAKLIADFRKFFME